VPALKPLKKAVLPVAGLGTRFLPATKAMAKEMLPVVDRPLIQYAIDEARAAGIEQFCLITGRGKTMLVEHFDVAYELERTLQERGKTAELAQLRAEAMPPGALVTVRRLHDLQLLHCYPEAASAVPVPPRVCALSLCAENHHTFVGTEDGGLCILANPIVNIQVLEAIAGELLNL